MRTFMTDETTILTPEMFAAVMTIADRYRNPGATTRTETQADIDAENAMWQALYEEDIADELDWLGEWGGLR